MKWKLKLLYKTSLRIFLRNDFSSPKTHDKLNFSGLPYNFKLLSYLD